MPGPTIWIPDPPLPLPLLWYTGASHPAALMIYIDEKDGTRDMERTKRDTWIEREGDSREINGNLWDLAEFGPRF